MFRTAILCLLVASSWVRADDLTWQTANLLGNIPLITSNSAGWLVQLYQDVDANTDLSTLTFDLDGNPFSGTGVSDDLRLAVYTTSLISQELFPGFPVVDFSFQTNAFADIFNSRVYTVLLNTNSWLSAVGGVNQTFVLDQTTFEIGDSGLEVYTVPNTNPGGHEWTAIIPEPGSLIMFGLGLWGLLSWRHRRMSPY